MDYIIGALAIFVVSLSGLALYDAFNYKCVEYGEYYTTMRYQSNGKTGIMVPHRTRDCLTKVKR